MFFAAAVQLHGIHHQPIGAWPRVGIISLELIDWPLRRPFGFIHQIQPELQGIAVCIVVGHICRSQTLGGLSSMLHSIELVYGTSEKHMLDKTHAV